MSDETPVPPPPTPSSPERAPLVVPQLFIDAFGLYLEPGQCAVTLATRFHPYADGAVDPTPRPIQVVRLPQHLARLLAQQLTKALDDSDQAVREQQAKVQQLMAEAKLAQEKAKALEEKPSES